MRYIILVLVVAAILVVHELLYRSHGSLVIDVYDGDTIVFVKDLDLTADEVGRKNIIILRVNDVRSKR